MSDITDPNTVHMPPHHPLAEHPPLKYTNPDDPLYDPHGYIYITNYPSSVKKSKIKENIAKLGVNPIAYEKVFQKKGLYMQFASPEEATAAKKNILQVKNNFIIDFRKPKKWDAKFRAREQERAEKRRKYASTLERDIEDQVTPLAKLPYVTQLKTKQAEVIKTLSKHLGYNFLESWMQADTMPEYLVDCIKRLGVVMVETRGAQFKVSKEYKEQATELFQLEVEKNMNNIHDLDDSSSCSPEERQEITRDACSKSLLLPYKFLPIVSSPQVNYYRNNCEFTCGMNKNNEKSVGFLPGSFVNGFVGVVESPAGLKHIPNSFVVLCERMETVVRKSPLSCYSKSDHSGFWRLLKIRANRSNEVIIMVQAKTEGCSVMEINDAKRQLIQEFSDVAFQREKNITVKGILFQDYDGVSNAAPEDCPLELIHGEEYIYEDVLGKRFRISMKSFFQVNTIGAEKLYSIAIDWAKTHCKDALLLDVCCGTGTIGIIMSKHVEQVVGLEINADAVEDAKENANLNEITNIEFVLGRAEDTIADVVDRYKNYKNIVAIVDPPRAGLHKTVLKTLRNTKEIDWIVYISCGPGSLAQDVRSLCGVPNRKQKLLNNQIHPFYPIQQVPVDMFPHTKHCENVMLLRRWNGKMIDTTPYRYLSKKGWQLKSADELDIVPISEEVLAEVKLEHDVKMEGESVNTNNNFDSNVDLLDTKDEIKEEQ